MFENRRQIFLKLPWLTLEILASHLKAGRVNGKTLPEVAP
jgi:hypothetical protein